MVWEWSLRIQYTPARRYRQPGDTLCHSEERSDVGIRFFLWRQYVFVRRYWTRIATASVRTGFAMTRWFTESPAQNPAGRCGHRPLHTAIGRHSVGADAYIVPVTPASLLCVGRGGPVAVPKISALPYGGRWKF